MVLEKPLLVGVGWMLAVKCWKSKNNGSENVTKKRLNVGNVNKTERERKNNGAVECWKRQTNCSLKRFQGPMLKTTKKIPERF